MINKILIYIICISFLGILIGIIGSFIQDKYLSEIINISLTIFELSFIFLLLGNGDFIKTREYNLTKLSISAVIIGALLQIMH